MKLTEIILALFCIFAAVYSFDPDNLNKCIISALLCIMAINALSKNEKLNRVLRGLSVFLAVFLFCRVLVGA